MQRWQGQLAESQARVAAANALAQQQQSRLAEAEDETARLRQVAWNVPWNVPWNVLWSVLWQELAGVVAQEEAKREDEATVRHAALRKSRKRTRCVDGCMASRLCGHV